MAKNFLKDGKRLLYLNSGADAIPSGALLPFGDLICVAVNDIEPGEEGVVGVEGVWALPCAMTGAAPRGTRLYLDAASGKVTDAESAITAGVLAEDAAGGAVEAAVKINV